MKRLTFATMALAVLGLFVVQQSPGSTATGYRMSPALRYALAVESGQKPRLLPNGQPVPIPSGAVMAALDAGLGITSTGQRLPTSFPATGALPAVIGTTGCPNTFKATGLPDNVRANQDCGYRFQSEEWVAVNPTDPNNIVVSQNDSKLSGNHTGVDFSVDGGTHWGDSVLPAGRVTIPAAPGGVWSFDAFSDPAHAFDSQGNLYYTTLGFDFAQDGFDGLFVWKSNSCLKGSALHTPGSGSCSPSFSPPLSASAIPIRTNFDNVALSDDKQLMAADTFPTSPFKDNVYVTWTLFDFSCNGGYCQSPIMFSKSSDGGSTWSTPKEISGENEHICKFGNAFNPNLSSHLCNFDQGSYPVVGPDGSINVVYNNCNLPPQPSTFLCQQLFVKSMDGGTTWSTPTRVGLDQDTQPFSVPGNELSSGCPLFRQCLPPNGYRMNDFPSMGVDAKSGKLAVFWSDFRNGGPCATDPSTGLPAEPCANHNNDVFVSVSKGGGATWGPTRLATAGGTSAQWQNWGDVGENGALYVGYYDRKYGACERSGCNDITLAKSTSGGSTWTYQRITTSSMPNLTCHNDPFQCGFLGDYMSIQAAGSSVDLTWGDTRGRDGGVPVPEEDVYFAKVPA